MGDHLADYVGLTDADQRQAGRIICEGLLVVRRAAELGLRFRSIVVTPARAREVGGLTDAPVHVVEPDELQAVTGFDVHRGVLASVERPADRAPDAVLAAHDTVLVVEGVNDHTNLGALFRNAAAFGAGVLLDPTTADPLYRRSIRVSMGHALAVPWARLERWPARLDRPLYALSPSADDDIGALPRGEPAAIVVGAEGTGLTPAALSCATRCFRIPMVDRVDSLNVATAAAIALHHRF